MPFAAQDPKEYKRSGVMPLQDGDMGVYGLYNADQWVYVGSGNIRGRLIGHLNRDNNCIGFQNPTQFVFEITNEYEAREIALRAELSPHCNPQQAE